MTVAARVVVVLMLMIVIVVVLVSVGLEFAVIVDHRGEIPVSALAATVVVMVVVVAVVLMLVIVVVMFALLVAVVVMMVLVVMLEGGPVDMVVESGTIDRVEHEVGELVFLDVEDSAHEVELHEIVALEDAVMLDTVVHVDEIEGNPLAIFHIHCGFDVTQQTTGFSLDEFPDLEKDVGKLGFRVGVPVLDGTGESGGGTVGFLD